MTFEVNDFITHHKRKIILKIVEIGINYYFLYDIMQKRYIYKDRLETERFFKRIKYQDPNNIMKEII